MKWVLVLMAALNGQPAEYHRVPGWSTKEACQTEAKKHWPFAFCVAGELPVPK